MFLSETSFRLACIRQIKVNFCLSHYSREHYHHFLCVVFKVQFFDHTTYAVLNWSSHLIRNFLFTKSNHQLKGLYSISTFFLFVNYFLVLTLPYVRVRTKNLKSTSLRLEFLRFLCFRQPPTLPCRLQHSTIGRSSLNHRVRDGNGCFP